jgi:hypothetical protein
MKENFRSIKVHKSIALIVTAMAISSPAPADAEGDPYTYQTIAVAATWDSCEPTREGALRWARRALTNSANDDCRDLGNGWRFSEISFGGYEDPPLP